MNENSRRVLEMLAEGKVTVDEAERLISLVDGEPAATASTQQMAHRAPEAARFLRVTIDSDGGEHVDVRIPLALIKAGVKLHTLLPEQAAKGIRKTMKKQGIDLDLHDLRTDGLEQLIDALSEIEVNVQDGEDKVRVYCE